MKTKEKIGIKSYVLRGGRISKFQKKSLKDLSPEFCIEYSENKICFGDIFRNYTEKNPVIIEIGFGMGSATSEIAVKNPGTFYIGIEVYKPGIGNLLGEIKKNNIENLKIINHDAVLAISNMFGDNSLDGIHIFFPDPWPKKKHHKRRLINEEFIGLISKKMKKNGYVYISTDWEDYAAQISKVFSNFPEFQNKSETEKPDWRPLTRFEKKGLIKNHRIFQFYYKKV